LGLILATRFALNLCSISLTATKMCNVNSKLRHQVVGNTVIGAVYLAGTYSPVEVEASSTSTVPACTCTCTCIATYYYFVLPPLGINRRN